MSYYLGDQMEQDKISGAYRTHGKGKEVHLQFLYRKTPLGKVTTR